MDDRRLGDAMRAVRIRRRLRQVDVSRAAGVSAATVSRAERGHFGQLAVDQLRRVASALDVRIELVPRWRGGDLDRLLNARHSALHESVARHFEGLEAWLAVPEVSFSIYGERGIIDLLAYHPGRRALLVVELKTEIVDVQELIGTLDRKRRLARAVAADRDRGWHADAVSTWVVVAASKMNRRRAVAHRAVLAAAFPGDGRKVRGWLRDPAAPMRVLSFWSIGHPRNVKGNLPAQKRVRKPRTTTS